MSPRGNDKAENSYIGLQEPEVEMPPDPVKPYQVKSPLLRECMAEFIGTMAINCPPWHASSTKRTDHFEHALDKGNPTQR
ncbi:hypothetical protein C6341_g21434 [Phytophthora cactorum]|nr:hypothetical protein C6341_g21434 [Phytophthora cactorum]